MAIVRGTGEGAPGADRAGHDGLQGGARGRQGRPRRARSSTCARRAWPPRPRSAHREAKRRASSASYIHPGSKIGVLVEVNCETDFVARTDDFQQLVKDLAMQVAAANPLYVVARGGAGGGRREGAGDLPRSRWPTRRSRPQVRRQDRRGQAREVLRGVVPARAAVHPDATGKTRLKDMVDQATAKMGEHIVVKRFARFQVGEELGRPWPPPGAAPAYRRVLLKLSGEALAGSQGYGIDPDVIGRIAEEIARGGRASACELAIVIGGGNIFRGIAASARGMDRATGRLHGHARHRDQRARAAGRAREGGRAHARALRHRDARGRRAVHPPPRHPPPREGPRRGLRGRHRQPVLHHRHRGARCARWRSAPR